MRAWLLASNQKTIALWPTLMGVFNLLTLFEKHSTFYHCLSVTCLTVSLVLRHYTMKGRPEMVRWLFFTFGLVQSFFFFMFWRHVKHGDVCPPVHYYLDPVTNLYTVVPQLIMADLPLIPHILFRLAHFAGGVSMYIHVVGHSFKVAILRGIFIHGIVCSLGYMYTTRKLQVSYNAYLAAKQQQKVANVAPPWAEDDPALSKPSKAALLPPKGCRESEYGFHKAPQPAPTALESSEGDMQGVVTEPRSACMHTSPDPAPAVPPGRWSVVPMQQLPSADQGEAAAMGDAEAQLCKGQLVSNELEAWVAATRARAYSSRLKKWKTTVKVYGEVEPESFSKDVYTDIVTITTSRFPGVLAVDAAIRHGCVVLSVEWSAPRGTCGGPQESQPEEDINAERILEAATRWATLTLLEGPEHGTELTVQVMGKFYRCNWDAPSRTWVLAADAVSWKAGEHCSMSLACMALPLPATGKEQEGQHPLCAASLEHRHSVCSSCSSNYSCGLQATQTLAQGADGGKAKASNLVHMGATVFCPAGEAQIKGWREGRHHEHERDGEEGVVEASKPQQLQILARTTGAFLPVDVVQAKQHGQEVQVTLALHLSDQLVGSFGRVSLELWHSLPGQKLLLQSVPLLLLPHSAHALAAELNAWCQNTATKPHRGPEAVVEFMDDMAYWLHAQRQMMQAQQQQHEGEGILLMAELGRDLLEHCVKEGMVEGAENVLELLLAGPYQLRFADIAYGSLSAGVGSAAAGSVGAVEREQLMQLAVLSGSIRMVEQVISWENKHTLRRNYTSSTCSSSSTSSWRWLEKGRAGVSPTQVLHAVPSPTREEMQQLLMAEAPYDADLSRALGVTGSIWSGPPSLGDSLPCKDAMAYAAHTQLQQQLTEGVVNAAIQGMCALQQQQQQQPPSSGGTSKKHALLSALRCLGRGGFIQCNDGVDEATYRAWCCQVSHATPCRWLPFACYLLLVVSMTCAAADRNVLIFLSQPQWMGSMPANTLFSSVPATYMLLQSRSSRAQRGASYKLCLLLSCMALLLSGTLGSFAQPLLLQSLAVILSLTIGMIIDVTNRCYFLCCQPALLYGGRRAKEAA